MADARKAILTLGHSNHEAAYLIDLVRMNAVDTVVDVRSHPFSRYNPQFNEAALRDTLNTAGMNYLKRSRDLGGRPRQDACYDENGRVVYARVAQLPGFQAALEQVVDTAAHRTVALLCTEREPLQCHRTLLIAHELRRAGRAVEHIAADANRETHEAVMRRLAEMHGQQAGADMFRSEQQVLDDLVEMQARRVAYVDRRRTQA